MSEPAKPFACGIADCGMSFTNEDHLHVHTKKHDMYLQLDSEQKAAFVADQTPTPTRFIRNCEEVGLFQDLQNVAANPFDEGFKRAMDAKAGILSLETINASSDDVLHTPQMMFPLLDTGECQSFNAQRNVTISRSSSDECGTIKGFETRTISKLTNEVTTISRIVNSDDATIKHTDIQKNNVIHIESNVIRKDIDNSKPVRVYTDSIVRETLKDSIMDNMTKVDKHSIDNIKLLPEKMPIMSQRSIDRVVDSLNSDSEITSRVFSKNLVGDNRKTKEVAVFDVFTHKVGNDEMAKITKLLKKDLIPQKINATPRILARKEVVNDETEQSEDFEVVIKLPGGKRVKMKPVEEPNYKEVIRNRITNKISKPNIVVKNMNNPLSPLPSIVKIPTGTLIPVTLVNQEGAPLSGNDLNNVPITKINNVADIVNMKLPVKQIDNANVNKEKTAPKKGNPKIVHIKKSIVQVTNPLCVKVSEPYQILDNNDKNSAKMKSTESNKEVRSEEDLKTKESNNKDSENNLHDEDDDDDDDCVVIDEISNDPGSAKRQRIELERRCAASKRYRERLKYAMGKQTEENRQLREANQKLIAEKAVLKLLITEHMKGCPNAGDIVDRLTLLHGGSL